MSDPIKVPLHITNDEAGVLGNLHITDDIAEQIVAATKLPGKFAAHEANTLQRLASLEQHVNTLVLSAEADGVHAIEQIRAKLAQLEKDHADAAGELRVNVRDCAPGTLAGKLLSANVILRYTKGDLLARAADAEQERDKAQNDVAILQGSLKASSARENALGITLKRYEESLGSMRAERDKALAELAAERGINFGLKTDLLAERERSVEKASEQGAEYNRMMDERNAAVASPAPSESRC